MKKIRIISLGEIVAPNLARGVVLLAGIIAEKASIAQNLTLPRVQKVLQAQPQLEMIKAFKEGQLTEAAFDEWMVKAHCDEFQAELKDKAFTADDFNAAWNAMNPLYADFAGELGVASDFHRTKDCELVFISYTNLKDTRHLVEQLALHNIPYQFDNNQQLSGINGIPLHTTYTKQCTKAALITNVVMGLMRAKTPGFFNANQVEMDIKYIRGVNGIEGMDAMRKEFDQTSAAVEEAANGLRVDSVLWEKKAMSFLDVLNAENLDHGLLSVAKL